MKRPGENVYHFSIRSLENDEFLGFAELDGIDWSHASRGLGIGLGDPDNWDKGYGRDAMKLLLDFAFSEMNMHRIGWPCSPTTSGPGRYRRSSGSFMRAPTARGFCVMGRDSTCCPTDFSGGNGNPPGPDTRPRPLLVSDY